MKTFIKIFFSLLFFELIIGIASAFITQMTSLKLVASLFHVIINLFSYPLYLIDKSYPFYAEGPAWFGILLTVVNLLIQTIFIYLIFKLKRKK